MHKQSWKDFWWKSLLNFHWECGSVQKRQCFSMIKNISKMISTYSVPQFHEILFFVWSGCVFICAQNPYYTFSWIAPRSVLLGIHMANRTATDKHLLCPRAHLFIWKYMLLDSVVYLFSRIVQYMMNAQKMCIETFQRILSHTDVIGKVNIRYENLDKLWVPWLLFITYFS